jgi:peptidoglycan/LPS O-acetylase OafA/YrhL
LGLNRDSVFPGISALIPVAAAALIIIGVGEKSIVNGVLGSRLFVFFGKISYSLYLVHWPIVCAFATFGLLDGRFRSIAGILLSIFVAWISYTFVEQKFRHGKIKNPKRVYGVVASCALLVLFVGTGSSMLANSIWEANPGAMALARPAVFLDLTLEIPIAF